MAKTVLICSNFYPPQAIGGAEIIAHCHAKLLRQRGYKVIIFAGESDPGSQRYAIRQDQYEGLTVFRACLRPEDYRLDGVNFSQPAIDRHFEILIDAFAPDVVHMHNIAGLSAGIIQISGQKGIRTVLTLHDHWGICYKNTLLKKGNEICQDYTRCAECLPFIADGAERQIPIQMRRDFLKLQFAGVDVFISPSLYLAEVYARAGIPVEKIRVIWNGVDVARFSSLSRSPSQGAVRFTFIGHFGWHKGIDIIVDALHHIPRSHKISMNLVGGGELADHIHARVQALGLQSIVRFWGRVDNSRIEEVLRETDALILPSIWPENQPVSITEAMAARTPVIASAIGGIPELIIDGYNGYLFQPGSAEGLARKMLEFIMHPDHIAPFGENGFKIIRDKSFEHQMDMICSMYE